MITEDYVSFETAKLLKEKGFDCVCKVWYSEYTSQFGGEKYTSIEFDDHNRFEKDYKFLFYAPTLQMAMKWLREVHNLHVDSSIYTDTDGDSEHEYTYTYWDWLIFNSESGRRIAEPQIGCGRYDSYEQACEAAIKYCLENLVSNIVNIREENWEKILHYFNNVCDDKILVCPKCGMPYREGYICNNCDNDNSAYEINGTSEEWFPENLVE